jgi:hypothetical protein
MANPVGRPSKYNDEILEQAEAYMLGGWKEVNDTIPSLAGLACYLGLSRETVNAWSHEKKEFSDITSGILALQERELVNRGLLKEFDSGISKLILGKHGYTDKVQQDHTSSDGSMAQKPAIELTDEQLLKIASGNAK